MDRKEYFRDYYNKKIKDNNDFYEKEKLRVAEYIKNRKMNDIEFANRLKEHRKQYRLRKKIKEQSQSVE